MVETVTTEAYGLEFEVPASDTGVGLCLRDYGEFARPELDFIIASCRGDLLDVGANVGAICLPLATARPKATVVAIEAHPGLAGILRRNAGRNGLSNVRVVEAVAGERSGWIDAPVSRLDVEANHGASSLYTKGQPMQRLRVLALDEIAPERLSFVKLDVEGFEPRVLDGAKHLLMDVRPTWLVEVSKSRPNTTAQVFERLRGAGYKLHWFFSPFVTRKRPRRLDEHPKLRGDISVVATDQPPLWDLQEVGDDWPSDVSDFGYLAEYGLVSGSAHSSAG